MHEKVASIDLSRRLVDQIWVAEVHLDEHHRLYHSNWSSRGRFWSWKVLKESAALAENVNCWTHKLQSVDLTGFMKLCKCFASFKLHQHLLTPSCEIFMVSKITSSVNGSSCLLFSDFSTLNDRVGFNRRAWNELIVIDFRLLPDHCDENPAANLSSF